MARPDEQGRVKHGVRPAQTGDIDQEGQFTQVTPHRLAARPTANEEKACT